jgi:hypothetical protein
MASGVHVVAVRNRLALPQKEEMIPAVGQDLSDHSM